MNAKVTKYEHQCALMLVDVHCKKRNKGGDAMQRPDVIKTAIPLQ